MPATERGTMLAISDTLHVLFNEYEDVTHDA